MNFDYNGLISPSVPQWNLLALWLSQEETFNQSNQSAFIKCPFN